MRSTDEKLDRCRMHAEAADALRPLLENPACVLWFHEYEQAIIARMATARIDDDVTRRNAAITLAVFKDFRQHLTDCATRGVRAAKVMKKIEQDAKSKSNG